MLALGAKHITDAFCGLRFTLDRQNLADTRSLVTQLLQVYYIPATFHADRVSVDDHCVFG